MNRKFLYLESISRRYGSSDFNEPIYNLYRGLKVTSMSLDLGMNPRDLYYEVMSNCPEVPPFTGNERDLFEICDIVRTMSKEECLLFLEYLYRHHGRELFGPVMIPNTLAELMFKNMKKSCSKVYIPNCDQFGVSLLNLIRSYPETRFDLSCDGKSRTELYKLIYNLHNVEFVDPDLYKSEFSLGKYDLIICLPEMGGRKVVDGLDYISKEPALIAAQNLLYHLTLEGKLVIVLPAKVTFGGGDVSTFRKYIEDNYKINEISSLPNRLFYPYMGINTYLFAFSNGSTEDIVVKKFSLDKDSKELKLLVDDEKLLFPDEFEKINDWSIDMAFIEEDEEVYEFVNSAIKKNIIKDVASVFRGKAVTGKADDGNISVINISDITETGINYSSLDTFNEEERKVSRYILEEGDVLVTSRGTTIKIAVFHDQPGKIIIPSSNINVIRTNKLLKGAYLKMFLESSVGMKMLKSLQRGTTIVNINYQDMETLEVPVPPIEKQEQLISKYESGLELYRKTIEAAQKAWDSIQKEIDKELY